MFTELSTEEEEGDEEDEDSSSDEFTDSIEEDEVTARSSASEAVRDVLQESDVEELEEAKETLEVKLEGAGSHPEEGGVTSVVQMRYRCISALPTVQLLHAKHFSEFDLFILLTGVNCRGPPWETDPLEKEHQLEPRHREQTQKRT